MAGTCKGREQIELKGEEMNKTNRKKGDAKE